MGVNNVLIGPVGATGPTGPQGPQGSAASGLVTQSQLDAVAGGLGSANAQTTDYTLALTDAGKSVEVSNAGTKTVTVPANSTVAFAIGTIIEVARMGAGAVNIAAAGGVTIRSRGSLLGIGNQYSTVSLRKRDTNEWVLVGDLA